MSPNETMTDSERLALRWVEKHLRVHRCRDCDKTWITGRSVGVLMHRCVIRSAVEHGHYPTRLERLHEDRMSWARTQLGGAFEDALDPDSLLRELDDDE